MQSNSQKNVATKLLTVWMMASFAIMLMCGCQTAVPLKLGNLPPAKRTVRKELIMLSKATDARKTPSDQVGRHTISVFMIPGPGVFTSCGHVEDVIAAHSKVGLEKAGYSVSTVEHLEDANGPVLTVQINYIRNYCFTWLYPLGVTFGKMQLSLVLFNQEKNVLWKTDLKSRSGFMPSAFYMSGFGTATKMQVTASVEEIMAACTSPEFIAALEAERL